MPDLRLEQQPAALLQLELLLLHQRLYQHRRQQQSRLMLMLPSADHHLQLSLVRVWRAKAILRIHDDRRRGYRAPGAENCTIRLGSVRGA